MRLRPLLLFLLATVVTACGVDVTEPDLAERVVGGDPDVGRAIVQVPVYGCGACHTLPDIIGARGVVGPSLAGFGDRIYLAGQMPNQPGLLVDWLVDPSRLVPDTAMPNVGLSADEARHVAAYLYTLRDPRGGWPRPWW